MTDLLLTNYKKRRHLKRRKMKEESNDASDGVSSCSVGRVIKSMSISLGAPMCIIRAVM